MSESISQTGSKPENAECAQDTNRSLALTGATGFVGQRLLKRLSEDGWQVKALYRPKKNHAPQEIQGVEWIAGDLKDETAINELVAGTHTVIHCAGVVRGASRQDFDSVNEDGALCIAKAAARLEDAPRFLLISSLAAREPDLSHYAGSKWRGECAIKSVSETMRWTILRPPAVFGPGDKEMLPLFKGMAKGFLTVPGGNEGRFSLIYVDDLANAVVSWLGTEAGYGKTLELDDGRQGGYDWDTMMDIGSKVLRNGKAVRRISIPVVWLKLFAKINFNLSTVLGYAPMLTPGKVREITHSDWVSDAQEFTALTGWRPNFRLESGLACIFGKNTSKFEDC